MRIICDWLFSGGLNSRRLNSLLKEAKVSVLDVNESSMSFKINNKDTVSYRSFGNFNEDLSRLKYYFMNNLRFSVIKEIDNEDVFNDFDGGKVKAYAVNSSMTSFETNKGYARRFSFSEFFKVKNVDFEQIIIRPWVLD